MRFSLTVLSVFVLGLVLHAASNKLLPNPKQHCEGGTCESTNAKFTEDLVRELDDNIATIKILMADFDELLYLAQKLKKQYGFTSVPEGSLWSLEAASPQAAVNAVRRKPHHGLLGALMDFTDASPNTAPMQCDYPRANNKAHHQQKEFHKYMGLTSVHLRIYYWIRVYQNRRRPRGTRTRLHDEIDEIWRRSRALATDDGKFRVGLTRRTLRAELGQLEQSQACNSGSPFDGLYALGLLITSVKGHDVVGLCLEVCHECNIPDTMPCRRRHRVEVTNPSVEVSTFAWQIWNTCIGLLMHAASITPFTWRRMMQKDVEFLTSALAFSPFKVLAMSGIPLRWVARATYKTSSRRSLRYPSPSALAKAIGMAEVSYLNAGSVDNLDPHLWGFLSPAEAGSRYRRLDFLKVQRHYRLGCSSDRCDFTFDDKQLSSKHCSLLWNGREDINSSVALFDWSRGGTFVNGALLGKRQYVTLKEGDKITLGHHDGPAYIFHQVPQGGNDIFRAAYILIELAGQGGYGNVWRVMSRITGRIYTCKFISVRNFRRAFDHTRAARQMIMREVTVLEKIQHPNVCQIKEWYYENDRLSIIIEWMSGGDLFDYIKQHGSLAESEAQRITRQLCSALSYIHSLGIAHRDLKPENILLTGDTPPVVKLADFGLAKDCGSRSMLRSFCGTPPYMAPEVGASNETYSQIVDSWAVGVTVFHMLAGERPVILLEPDHGRLMDWELMLKADVTPEAFDFVDSLLAEDPSLRMSVEDALQHPWLQEVVPPQVQNVDQQ
ncbi:hypothetical protein NM688_g5766 [Phlebia brevispora]|uniref:Uncharacterized protein n=1 Tax=Phlebia brevispora TaxID=194682 RepID=A0ACC1SPY1_9APHY|nr:hypothetical protein NM688_g5766 [Phlebia brevispora]